MNGDTIYRLRRDVRHRSILDEAIVVRQRDAEVLVLNEVGACLVELVEAGTSLSTLLEELEERFDVEPAVLREDISRFLQELMEAGVIEEVADPAASEPEDAIG